MAIWKQGGFFQELAEREQHLQWFPKAYVPAAKKDDEFVVSITCCACGKCAYCLKQIECKKQAEEAKKKAEEEKKKKEAAEKAKECKCVI
ncbi:hypothetical protein EV175_005192 [Coemansia sp. RSA 1933]|nr:hypothetical protein EV175_005192 [Coemansia sp. RSA 1933]